MEFELGAFVEELRREMYSRFPYENDYLNQRKHPNTPEHIRDVAFMNLPVTINMNTRTFDIGSYMSEAKYPYYHILQDAPVIRKKGRGTDKTKGSQRMVENKGLRDYGRVSFNGKTYSKEYAKNVRGARKSVIERATYFSDGKRMKARSLSYRNIHYKYIDNILDMVLPILATRYGGTMGKSRNTSLAEEYNMQQDEEMNERFEIENMLDSFM